MMFNYPFMNFRNKFYPYRYYNYPSYQNKQNISYSEYEQNKNSKGNESQKTAGPETSYTISRNLEDRGSNEQFLSILGIKLYFDDLIILTLLFFLYNEGVKDEGLFICLILLLLS